MFHRIDYKNKPKSILLTKGMSNYDKLQRDLNAPVKDYNQIKDLVELDAHQSTVINHSNNSITKLSNIENKKSQKSVEMMAHKKGRFG